MATFSNQATLTYLDTETNSNVVTGELLDVLSNHLKRTLKNKT